MTPTRPEYFIWTTPAGEEYLLKFATYCQKPPSSVEAAQKILDNWMLYSPDQYRLLEGDSWTPPLVTPVAKVNPGYYPSYPGTRRARARGLPRVEA